MPYKAVTIILCLSSTYSISDVERLDNEMIVTANDYSQKGGPEHNEIIFQLPRDLIYVDGTIVINGKLAQNRKSLRIGLMSGAVNSVKTPLYYITFDYVGNEILFERDENGSLKVEQQEELSSLSVDSNFKFHMKFMKNSQGVINLVTMLGAYGFKDVPLLTETELQKNIFLSINEDTLKISQLDFIWN